MAFQDWDSLTTRHRQKLNRLCGNRDYILDKMSAGYTLQRRGTFYSDLPAEFLNSPNGGRYFSFAELVEWMKTAPVIR